jgi:hypothetical protein
MTTPEVYARWANATINVELRNVAWQRWQNAAYDCRMYRISFYMYPECVTAEKIAAYRAAKWSERAARIAYDALERRQS